MGIMGILEQKMSKKYLILDENGEIVEVFKNINGAKNYIVYQKKLSNLKYTMKEVEK